MSSALPNNLRGMRLYQLVITVITGAMVLLGATPEEFASGVRDRCQNAYELLLKAARPVLHYGSEAEDAWLVLPPSFFRTSAYICHYICHSINVAFVCSCCLLESWELIFYKQRHSRSMRFATLP